MRQLIFFLIIITLLFACKNSDPEAEEPKSKEFVSYVFGEKNYTFPEFSDLTEEEVKHWGVLKDLLQEIKNIYGADYLELQSRSENILQYTDSVVNSVPEKLNSNSINSRLLVLKTRAALLYESSYQGSIDTFKMQNSIRELNKATTNLILQFNEKVQKDEIRTINRKR